MSIYSGFATRTQENYYDQILYNVISTLLVRVSKFYHNEEVDENSFFKIISNQQKVLKKLQKRKYLQPKYAQLLQNFLMNLEGESVPIKKPEGKNMGRTLSVLDKQFKELRQANQNIMTLDRGDASSLGKINQKVKRSKRKIKSKKNSIKTNLDVWQFKSEKKQPQLPSLRPNIQQHLLTHSKFNTKVNFSQANSRQISEGQESSIQLNQKTENIRALNRPPKFRAKMYFKQS